MKQDRVKQLFQKARSMRQPHEDQMRRAYEYTLPGRDFDRAAEAESGDVDRSHIYDSTAVDAVRNLATQTIQLLIPQNSQWATVEYRDAAVEARAGRQMKGWVKTVNDRLFAHVTTSNFYQAVGEAMLDLVIAGTSCLAVQDRPGYPISYQAVPIGQIFFLEDFMGNIDAVFRRHQMSVRQISERWGLPQCLEEAKPTDVASVLEVDIRQGDTWEYAVYLEKDFSELEAAKKHRFNSFIVFRWEKTVGELWGDSPIRSALPHILTVNKMMETVLAMGEFQALGLWQTADETMNLENLRKHLQPGGVIVTSPEGELRPVAFGGNFNISQAMIEEQRAIIRRMTFDSSLPPSADGKSYMTAQEVITRANEYYQRIGQPAQRLADELLRPLARQMLWRLGERDELPAFPDEWMASLQAQGFEVSELKDLFKASITAAITQARRFQEAQRDLQAVGTVGQILGPEVVAGIVDMEGLAKRLLTNMNFSADLVRSDEEIAANKQQMMQNAQSQQAVQAGQEISKIAKNMGVDAQQLQQMMGGNAE